MHLTCPLVPDNGPLQPWQKVEGEADTSNRKNREKRQRLGAPGHKGKMKQRRHQVPHDQNGQIGRAIIRAVVVQGLAANLTGIIDL